MVKWKLFDRNNLVEQISPIHRRNDLDNAQTTACHVIERFWRVTPLVIRSHAHSSTVLSHLHFCCIKFLPVTLSKTTMLFISCIYHGSGCRATAKSLDEFCLGGCGASILACFVSLLQKINGLC